MKKSIIILSFILNVFSIYAGTNKFHAFLTQDTFLINTTSQKILNIVADSTPIYKNAKLKIAFPKYFSEFAWEGMVWITIPPNLRPGYLQVKHNNGTVIGRVLSANFSSSEFPSIPSNIFDYKFSHDANQYVVTIELLDTLPKGDTLKIIYGANGTPTYTYNSMIAYKENYTILIDNLVGNYSVFNSQPEIVFKYSIAKSLYLSANSVCSINSNNLLKLAVHDVGKNIAEDFIGTVKIACSDPSAMPEQIVNITFPDKGKKLVNLIFSKSGSFTIYATVISGNQTITGSYKSNPILVSNNSMNTYWGELHTHTKFSRDGFGSNAYYYAKYGVGLDFYSGTDHADFNSVDTFGINPVEWNQLKDESTQTNEVNKFVSFLGYENSLDNPSGHYNFIYNFNESQINNVPMITKFPLFTIQNIWQKLNSLNKQGVVLTIPHHTGKLFGATGVDVPASAFGGIYANSTYKTLTEIYSGHGLCEYYNPNHALAYERFGARSTTYPCYAQDGWALGEKLGVISSTDSHNGRMAQTNTGITAIISDSLNRNSLFESLKKRHTYATTGERIILDFKIGNNIMGDELNISKDSFPTIKFNVIGTDAIDYIELLKWDFKKGTYTVSPRHPIFKIIYKNSFPSSTLNYSFSFIDTTLKDSSLYYIRIKQKNIISNREVWAWSSPIWINKLTNTISYNSDSLYNFNVFNQNNTKIKASWCMKDEFNSNYYVIERSSGDSTHFITLDTVQTIHLAFYDSCYTYFDLLPNDSILYYRIKIIGYNDSVKYSSIQKIIISSIFDSIYGLNISLENDRINVNWQAKEFSVINYNSEKGKSDIQYQSFANTNPNFNSQPNTYTIADFFPFKDTSFYRVVMNLSDGRFLISNIDTLIFRKDSLFKFATDLIGNEVNAYWESEHEQETIKYELQRSQDNSIFYTLETIIPIGSLFDTTHYSYTDTTTMVGWNYYRVLQYLSDGTVKISKIDSEFILNTSTTQFKNEIVDIKIYNNLIDEGHSYLQLYTTSPQDILGEYLIVSTDGRLEYRTKEVLRKGSAIESIPIGNLSSGIYYLIFISNDLIIKNKFMIIFHGGCQH